MEKKPVDIDALRAFAAKKERLTTADLLDYVNLHPGEDFSEGRLFSALRKIGMTQVWVQRK